MRTIAFDPLKQRALPTALAVAAALALTACGGGGSSGGAVTAASGVVIDGYIENAKVCADLNENSVCDPDEPFTLTDANGNYTLPETGNATFILVETTAASKDADDNGDTLAEAGRQPFTLKAPATAIEGQEKFVVTPLTTMVSLAMKDDPNLTPQTAGEALVKQLGLGNPSEVNFFVDYKAANNTTNQFLGQMAQGIADSLGEAETLHKTEASGEFSDLKKDLFKDAMSRTWTAMVANVKPDGTLIRPPAEFKNAVKAEVQSGVATIVAAAKFAPDQTFLNNFDVKSALAVEGVTDRTRLYLADCRSKSHLLLDLSTAQKSKLGVSGTGQLQSIFCDTNDYALLSTVEIGNNSPWPVPRGHALFGNNLGSAKWKPFPTGESGDYYILTDEGLELYDGDQNATPKPFRPRTANPDAPTIVSEYKGRCFTVKASGYGERYCFDPVKLEGKKVSNLDPSCKSSYGGSCSVSEANDKTFPVGAMGFNVTQSFMYDTYQFFPEPDTAGGASPSESAISQSEGAISQSVGAEGKPSFSTITEGIAAAKSESKSVTVCDSDLFGNFTYFFSFQEGSKIKLTGISGPVDGQCDLGSEGDLVPDVAITAEQNVCDIKNSLTASGTRDREALDALCATGGGLAGIKIGPEEIAYEIVKPNSSTKAKDIEVFRTGMFGITRVLTKNFREQMGLVQGSEFSPTGFAATVINGDVAIGVYWVKDAPVSKLNFLDGEEKVFNHLAGKTILEVFGAPNFEAGNFEQVAY